MRRITAMSRHRDHLPGVASSMYFYGMREAPAIPLRDRGLSGCDLPNRAAARQGGRAGHAGRISRPGSCRPGKPATCPCASRRGWRSRYRPGTPEATARGKVARGSCGATRPGACRRWRGKCRGLWRSGWGFRPWRGADQVSPKGAMGLVSNRGTGNDGPVSTAAASSFLNAARWAGEDQRADRDGPAGAAGAGAGLPGRVAAGAGRAGTGVGTGPSPSPGECRSVLWPARGWSGRPGLPP